MKGFHMDHYPFATQDWALVSHRTLSIDASQIRAIESLKGELWITVDGNSCDFLLKAGETHAVPARSGRVVIESLSASAMVRVALAAQSPLVAHVGPSFAQALTISVLRPIATLLCGFAKSLQQAAVHLDPKLSRGAR
ncbi:MAG: DUF2917 domain-containing protein [Betaproteobacteria bacterium]|nr:MAG: DUF2917 domain-containing protein [Betaproteobacteria bacterium]